MLPKKNLPWKRKCGRQWHSTLRLSPYLLFRKEKIFIIENILETTDQDLRSKIIQFPRNRRKGCIISQIMKTTKFYSTQPPQKYSATFKRNNMTNFIDDCER